MNSWTAGGVADGVKVALIDRVILHRDMVRVIAAGIRTGCHIEVLDGHAAYRGLNTLVSVNNSRLTVERLRAEHEDLLKKASNARELAATESDPRDAMPYREDARRYASAARTLHTRIDELTRTLTPASTPTEIKGEVDFLLTGLNVLLDADGRAHSEAGAALRQILDDLRFVVSGRTVTWSTRVLVPADGRVLALGPFTGAIAHHGHLLTPAQQSGQSLRAGQNLTRNTRVHALQRAGLTPLLAGVAILAPTDHLSRALCGESVVWPDCPAGFDHKRFNAHLRSEWTSGKTWAPRSYVISAEKRQTLTDLVAAMGGHARMDQLEAVVEDLGIKPSDLYWMTLPRPSLTPTTPGWQPSVRRVGVWSASNLKEQNCVESIPCPRCGNPATAVIRVLHVTGDLLCRQCLVAPALPGLEFPTPHADLALPESQIPVDLVRRAVSVMPGTRSKGRKPQTRAAM